MSMAIPIDRFNTLDYIFLTILLLCVFRGLWKGGIVILFNVVGLIAGFITAIHVYPQVGALLKSLIPSLSKPDLVAFIVVFFLSWFVIGGIGHWLSSLFAKAKLKFLDRLLGGFIGLVLAIAIQGMVFLALTLFLPLTHPILKESVIAPYVSKSSSALHSFISKHVGEELAKRREVLKRYWEDQSKGRSSRGD
ncbi:MAG: CvpA family protein [Syntrophobacterales bacterium]|nr:CvpA family protein [Syntrophobacterales bacterium]